MEESRTRAGDRTLDEHLQRWKLEREATQKSSSVVSATVNGSGIPPFGGGGG